MLFAVSEFVWFHITTVLQLLNTLSIIIIFDFRVHSQPTMLVVGSVIRAPLAQRYVSYLIFNVI